MSELFPPDSSPHPAPQPAGADAPLADRLRPLTLAEVIGQ